MSNGKYESGKYHTIAATRNVNLSVNEERIRLGIKVKNDKGVEYPVETDYFVCPKRIKNVFGEQPTELTVFFPVANREMVFPQAYEKYGGNQALQCQGDGEKTAQKKDQETGEWETIKCPCEHYEKVCKKVGYLRFMIPSVSIGTFFQCAIHGTVSINECNSGFFTADKTTGGRWAMIPFRMRRIPKKIKIPGSAKMKTHWVVTLEVAASTEEIRRVMAGEILYIGQLKEGKQYQLESTKPQEGIPPPVEEETEEEKWERQAGLHEKEAKENKQQKDSEAKLKKETEENKHNIRTPEQIKKKLEARNAILDEVVKVAKEHGVDNWRGIMDIGERHNVFAKGLVASQVKTYVVDHPDKCEELKEAIRCDEEITDEDIPGKLEVKDENAPFPGEKAERKISKAEDFINKSDMPE